MGVSELCATLLFLPVGATVGGAGVTVNLLSRRLVAFTSVVDARTLWFPARNEGGVGATSGAVGLTGTKS